ncbi:hypA-like protein [Aspergillus sclerotialis]|uniref:HypA-like protein n=1 Tax=Aspergillus sclerotialis TaxID=2070753 RepID=A0A3A2Z8T5_9EURO|nr:hypA-like protein [Aspergillus sclerotialis]
MATARKVHLTTSDTGVYSTKPREDAAKTASELLQDDMERHHVFFNDMHFHNHIVHHMLSIYALGASPEEIKAAYRRNSSYQRPVLPTKNDVVKFLSDKGSFKAALGKEENYPNFLAFFQNEIEAKGIGAVLNEYLFAGDEVAESMLARLFGGLIHPFIHLGFGVEFDQPAIVAQALAQAAVHGDYMGDLYLFLVEKAAANGKPGKKTMLQLLEEMRADKKLCASAHWSDGNKTEGVMERAPDEMIKYASQFTVSPDQLEEKMMEIINLVVYYTSAAQRPSKEIKYDFFLMHCVNASIFLSKFLALPSLDVKSKARLLEWKGRVDLLMYVSRGSPELRLDEVTNYKASKDWNTIFAKSIVHPGDDGHASKLMRALAHGEDVSRPYEAQAKEKGLLITGDMWLKIGNMAIDSLADQSSDMWVRSTGFDEAWTRFKDRARL